MLQLISFINNKLKTSFKTKIIKNSNFAVQIVPNEENFPKTNVKNHLCDNINFLRFAIDLYRKIFIRVQIIKWQN